MSVCKMVAILFMPHHIKGLPDPEWRFKIPTLKGVFKHDWLINMINVSKHDEMLTPVASY